MNKKQTGGDKIGEGASGCIFRPPLTCRSGKNASNKKYVGKVFDSKKNGLFEEEMMKKVKTLDSNGDHIIQLKKKCVVDPKDINPKDKCSLFKSKRMIQLIYEDGGISLYEYCNKNRGKYNILDLLNGFVNIVDGLVKMNKAGICHRDLKPANIMIMEDDLKMKITDFGLSTGHELIYNAHELYLLEHVYPYYPLEFKLYTFLIWDYEKKKKLIREDVIKLKKKLSLYFFSNQYTTNYKIQYDMMGLDKDQIKKDINGTVDNICKHVLKQQIDPSEINAQFEMISDKIDVFSCGICMMNAMMLSDHDHRKSEFVQELKSIISNAIHFDPIKRLSIDDMQAKLRKLKKNIDKHSVVSTTNTDIFIKHHASPSLKQTSCKKKTKSQLVSLLSSIKKRDPTILKKQRKKTLCNELYEK